MPCIDCLVGTPGLPMQAYCIFYMLSSSFPCFTYCLVGAHSWGLAYRSIIDASGLSNVESGKKDGLKQRIVVPLRMRTKNFAAIPLFSSSNFYRFSSSCSSSTTHQCLPVPTSAHQCPPVPTSVHQCPPMPTGAHQCPPAPTSAHQCPPVVPWISTSRGMTMTPLFFLMTMPSCVGL